MVAGAGSILNLRCDIGGVTPCVTLGVSLPCWTLSFPACEMEKLHHVVRMGPPAMLSLCVTVWSNKVLSVGRTLTLKLLKVCSFPLATILPHKARLREAGAVS